MIKKKYKILGDSFKQYIPLSKNTFAETKTNKITEKNQIPPWRFLKIIYNLI